MSLLSRLPNGYETARNSGENTPDRLGNVMQESMKSVIGDTDVGATSPVLQDTGPDEGWMNGSIRHAVFSATDPNIPGMLTDLAFTLESVNAAESLRTCGLRQRSKKSCTENGRLCYRLTYAEDLLFL